MSERPAILIVDDHPVNRKITQRALENLGYEAYTSASGSDALTHLAERPFAAILMDRYMPEWDGLETTRHLLERWGSNAPPVIGLSAGGENEEAECRAAGMVDFLAKPATAASLKRCLARWLPATPTSDAAPERDSSDDSQERAPNAIREAQGNSFAVFDEADALALMGGDPALLRQVVEVYLSVSETYLSTLRSAVLNEERQAASEAAHAIKSAACSLSAHELAHLTALMELNAPSLSSAACADLCQQIAEACLRLQKRLESTQVTSNHSQNEAPLV